MRQDGFIAGKAEHFGRGTEFNVYRIVVSVCKKAQCMVAQRKKFRAAMVIRNNFRKTKNLVC